MTFPFTLYQEKGGPAGHTSRNQDPDPAVKTEGDAGVTPDYPPAKDSDDVSVTNSKVESAMNHQPCRAILQDPDFQKSRLTASARPMHTFELLEMGLIGPQGNI